MKAVKAALFDLDGVVVDTEAEYTRFWDGQGRLYRPDIDNFALGIKGYTLRQVFDEFFADKPELHSKITEALDRHERSMAYEYVPGFVGFIGLLRENGIATALVTSSNNRKMEAVYAVRPEIRGFFDTIITAEDVRRSKPDPEGYLLAAARLGAGIDEAVVFEDSFSGLRAGKASGMAVIALTTTLDKSLAAPYSQLCIPNYEGAGVGILEDALSIRFQ